MEIVINKCYGGFGLSIEARNLYAKKKGFELFHYEKIAYKHECRKNSYKRLVDSARSGLAYSTTVDHGDEFEGDMSKGYWSDHDLERTDQALIEVVKELGDKASGNFSSLKVVEIPDDVEWEIDEYDGIEWISENHRTWD